MKKIISQLNGMEKISVSFTRGALHAVALCAVMLAVYCVILENRGDFSVRQAELIKASLEYIAASLSLGLCFGFLIDLAVKKGNGNT